MKFNEERGEYMKITDVTVNVIAKEGVNIKASASILIEDCFVVKGIRIIQRDNGYLVAMPNHKLSTGIYQDIAHPINSETREVVVNAVLNKFFEEVRKLLSAIERPVGYYLGFNRNNIHEITLFKEDIFTKTKQGPIVDTYDLENFETETLKELQEEIVEKVNKNSKEVEIIDSDSEKVSVIENTIMV